jgi:hypothetical protein
MKEPTRFAPLLEAIKALDDAERASLRAAKRRHEAPTGNRARVTTANADWARKAESRDRKLDAAAALACSTFHLTPRS